MLAHAPVAVIWDLDGVLVDSEPVCLAAERDLAAAHGADTSSLLSEVLGLSGLRAAQLIVRKLGLPLSAGEFLAQRDARLEVAFSRVALCKGALDAVRHVRAQGLPCAIATSSSRALSNVKRNAHVALFGAMDAVVCADDVEEAKPAPLLFLEAARRLRVDSACCVVFEDAPNGVRAAKAAGMRCVALRNAHVPADAYIGAGADFVVDSGSLLDFDFSLIALPPLSAQSGGVT